MNDAYRTALASLTNAARQCMLSPTMHATLAAMEAGTVMVPAYLIAPAFLPEVGGPILRQAAVRCIVWAQAELAIRAAERAQDDTQSEAMEALSALASQDDWSDVELDEARKAACAAFKSAARPDANQTSITYL